jgi:hypothetical protein
MPNHQILLQKIPEMKGMKTVNLYVQIEFQGLKYNTFERSQL